MKQQSLVDFLMQRIAEDEAAARAATPGVTALLTLVVVLAECAAKRKIVELHQPDDDKCSVCSHEIGYTSDGDGGEYYENHRTGDDWPCATLRALTAVYNEHPDYRQEWGTLWENPPQDGSAEMTDPLKHAPKGPDMRWQQPPRACEHNGDRIELRQLCSANPETICIDCGELIVTDQPTLAARADAAPVEPRTLPTDAEVANVMEAAFSDWVDRVTTNEDVPETEYETMAAAVLALFAAQPNPYRESEG